MPLKLNGRATLSKRARAQFDSGGRHQCSVDAAAHVQRIAHAMGKRQDGWVLGSPERSPTSRTATIAVETDNQEAVFFCLTAGKDRHYGKLVEWPMTAVLKTVGGKTARGFKSCTSRHGALFRYSGAI